MYASVEFSRSILTIGSERIAAASERFWLVHPP